MLKSYAITTTLSTGRFFAQTIKSINIEKVKDRVDATVLSKDGRHVIIWEMGKHEKHSKVYLDGDGYNNWVRI